MNVNGKNRGKKDLSSLHARVSSAHPLMSSAHLLVSSPRKRGSIQPYHKRLGYELSLQGILPIDPRLRGDDTRRCADDIRGCENDTRGCGDSSGESPHTRRKINSIAFASLLLSTILFLTACTVGPDYIRPAAPTPTAFKEAKGKTVIGSASKDWKIAEPADDKNRGEWWKIFRDPELNQLEDQLNHANQSILNAAANYEQALALVDEARANYFPTLVGSATLTREKQNSGTSSFVSSSTSGTATSTQTGTATSSSGSSSSKISTTHSLLLNATWEPDIWGSVRRSVEASRAGAESSAALLASTRLSSQASLAQYYF